MGKVDSLKKLAVTLGYGSDVSEYKGKTVVEVLKEVAVKMNITSSTKNIKAKSIDEVLNFIVNNYGSEEKEPYDLTITDTDATVTVKRNGVAIEEGTDILYNGDELTIEATVEDGYELTTLTVNSEDIESGDKITVSGNVTIVATGTEVEDPEIGG